MLCTESSLFATIPKFKILCSLQNNLMKALIICHHHAKFYTGFNLLLCVAELKVQQTMMTNSNPTMSETQLQEYRFHPKHKKSIRRWELHRHEVPTKKKNIDISSVEISIKIDFTE